MEYLEKYPNAKVRTITPFGCDEQHLDHKNLGFAVLELYNEGKIEDLEFFVEPYFCKGFREVNPDIELMVKKSYDEERFLRAVGSYRVWKPKEGKYAVGYHSARVYFNGFKKEKLAYIHKATCVMPMALNE